MEKSAITSIAVYSIIAIVIVASILIYISSNSQGPHPTSFVVNNRTYNISAYAYTTQQQEKGLMNATVNNSTFMLFYFKQPSIYYFWMKDTNSALDIIWLNYSASNHTARVVYFVNATPCASYSPSQNDCKVYAPTGDANFVLEAKSGFAQENNLAIGEQVKFIFK